MTNLLIGSSLVMVAATGFAQSPPAPELLSHTGSTHVQLDRQHPPKIGHDFYPPESRRLHEQGTCRIKASIDERGYPQDMELIATSGYERLDTACLQAFTEARFVPATEDGKPVKTTVVLPVTWAFGQPDANPMLVPGTRLEEGPEFYPRSALELKQEGDCIVHFLISEMGKTSDFSISQSSGYATLDQACVKAIQQAHFMPGRKGYVPYAKWMDLKLIWRLPK